MVDKKSPYLKFDHDDYAKTRPPDDFWGQIRRTVHGEPVSDEQIKIIVKAIKSGLRLKNNDIILDLACGNGALSHLLFDSCAELLGVDLSEYLVSVAKENFEALPHFRFEAHGAKEYVLLEPRPEKFSKVLCYGRFSYFSTADAAEVLGVLFEKFSNVEAVYIGNLPDKDRAAKFYKTKELNTDEMLDCSSQIGIWRTRSEFLQLASDARWDVKFLSMPAEFYASYYRYDVLLSR